jgi:hypothetical protein
MQYGGLICSALSMGLSLDIYGQSSAHSIGMFLSRSRTLGPSNQTSETDATFPIPPSLSLTIVLDQYRIFLTALFLVIRMFVPPLFLAFADDLSILRIGPKFLPVIISSAPALALRLAADDLLGAVNGT